MNNNKLRSLRRKTRIRKKLSAVKKHKLLVFRSSKHIYASVLTEQNDKTLCSFSSVKINKTEGQKKLDIAKLVGEKIAEMAGLNIPENTEFIIVPEDGWGPDHLFSGEKLSVVMALYKANNIDHAIELTNNIQSYQGQGHSCGIYSSSDENIMKLANITKTSRVMVNQPQAASNSGNLWNGMRQTFSLGCGSWGGNGTNNNISWRDLINETWVSKPLPQTKDCLLYTSPSPRDRG